MNLKQKEIDYIENDLEGILATMATLLGFNLESNAYVAESRKRTKRVFNVLMYLHKHYELIKK